MIAVSICQQNFKKIKNKMQRINKRYSLQISFKYNRNDVLTIFTPTSSKDSARSEIKGNTTLMAIDDTNSISLYVPYFEHTSYFMMTKTIHMMLKTKKWRIFSPFHDCIITLIPLRKTWTHRDCFHSLQLQLHKHCLLLH